MSITVVDRANTVGIAQNFSSYTPTWTGSSANPAIVDGTIAGRYTQIGKIVMAQITITMGASTTYGTGYWILTLPVTAANSSGGIGFGEITDNGTAWKDSFAKLLSTTTFAVSHDTNGNYASATYPMNWASGDILSITLLYEAA